MGLDMYLSDGGKEVGYWRKANAIHGWFVKNVQNGVDDCGEYPVSREKLQELMEACEKVLGGEDGLNKNAAKKLLPPTPGFFFGTYEVDEWYKQDLQQTIDIIKPLLQEAKDDALYTYQSSW